MQNADASSTAPAIQRRWDWKSTLEVATSLLLLLAAIGLLADRYLLRRASVRPPLKVPTQPLSIDDSPTMGSPTAPYVMFAYSDFECPFCGRFARDVLPALAREEIRNGRVQLVFRHFPLPMHKSAARAAQAAECAGKQGLFWPMHDKLFSQQKLDELALKTLARDLGVEQGAFDSCMTDPSIVERITKQSTQARALGMSSTPTFLLGSRGVNGQIAISRAFSGALPIEEFEVEIRQLGSGRRSFFQRIWG